MKNIGILAIQGSVIEHEKILQKLNMDYSLVRSKEEVKPL
ncbi:pyridoxal 5'-phosphate synthase glutaminase subunit PdxT, partial [Candidatus Parcubacteria bacterium]